MSDLINKFMKRLKDSDGNSLPEDVGVMDIANVSFHSSLGSKEYTFNVWFKKHTGIANRKTFSFRVGSIEKCLKIKEAMDNIYNINEDDLFSEEDKKLELNIETKLNSKDNFFNESKTPF